jgi:sigma-B regulation protein RsbU (phosphoserine phosphatase)
VVDIGSRQLSYVNAGHNPPLGVGAEGHFLRLDPTGPALGILDNASYTCVTVPVPPDTSFLFYTDGLTEWRDRREEMFDEERAAARLNACRGQPAEVLVTSMLGAVTQFAGGAEPEDDVTLLAVHVRA